MYQHCLGLFRVAFGYLETFLQRIPSPLQISGSPSPSEPHEPSNSALILVPAAVRCEKCNNQKPRELVALVWLFICAVVAASHIESQERRRILRQTAHSLHAASPWLAAMIMTMYLYSGALNEGLSSLQAPVSASRTCLGPTSAYHSMSARGTTR